MVNQQLLEYVRGQLKAGVSKQQITTIVSGGGWTPADVAEAFAIIEGPSLKPLPPPAPPPPTPAQPVSAAPVFMPAPQQPTPSPAPAARPAPTPTPRMHHPRRMFAIVLLAVLILAGGGVAYAYTTGKLALIESYIPFLSHAPYDKSMLLSGVAQGIGAINTSAWDVNVHIFTESRDADAVPFNATSTQAKGYSLGLLAAFIPASFDATVDVNGAVQKTAASTNARAAFSVNLTSEDLTLALAAEMRKVGDNLYGIITKIPGLFGDFSAIKNKWVIITPDDQKKYSSELHLGVSIPQQQNDKQQQSLQDFKTILALEDKDHVLLSADPKQVVVGDESLYEYDVTIDAAALPVFYADAMQAFAGEASSSLHFDQKTLDYLNSAEGQRFADYLSKNMTITMWADAKGIPHKFEASLRIVPGSDVLKLAGKQVRVVGDLTLSNINQPITIDAPTSTIPLDQAYSLATGQTLQALEDARAKSRDARRMADVQQIRIALELYYNDHGSYPSTTAFLAPQYIFTLPTDPLDKITYYYTAKGSSSYTLSADLETPEPSMIKSKGVTISTKNCAGVANGRFCYRASP